MSPDSTEDVLQDEGIADNLRSVKVRIATAAQDAGRAVGDVTLVAVSKGHVAERPRAAIAAGHRVFGENRVQEAAMSAVTSNCTSLVRCKPTRLVKRWLRST